MSYDLVVIGTGPGGYVCAIRAAQLGLKTAVVEKRKTHGGTCLNIGCIPSKALLHASEVYEEVAHGLGGLGVVVGKPKLDLAGMMKHKDETVGANVQGVAFLLKKNKVDAYFGAGSIPAAGKVEVTADDGSKQVLETKNIVIATGSDVTPLPGVTIDEKIVVSSTGALALGKVPAKLIVVGAGVIGLELGSVWRRLGAEVTVVEYLDRILPGMDSETCKQFQRLLEKQGVKFQLASKVTKVETAKAGAKVTVEPAAGGDAQVLDADVVLVAIGRRPYTEGLGLERWASRWNAARSSSTHKFSTNVPGVYAIGDVVARPDAGAQGRGRRRRLGGNAFRPTWPRELRRHSRRGLHLSGNRQRRRDRGRPEGQGHRLQERKISVHGQWPRPRHASYRWFREGSGGCCD